MENKTTKIEIDIYGDVRECDRNGSCVHYKDSSGHEIWYDNDEYGREIHSLNSNEYETWSAYDTKGRKIFFKNSDGDEYHRIFDENGDIIFNKHPDDVREIDTEEFLWIKRALFDRVLSAPRMTFKHIQIIENATTIDDISDELVYDIFNEILYVKQDSLFNKKGGSIIDLIESMS